MNYKWACSDCAQHKAEEGTLQRSWPRPAVHAAERVGISELPTAEQEYFDKAAAALRTDASTSHIYFKVGTARLRRPRLGRQLTTRAQSRPPRHCSVRQWLIAGASSAVPACLLGFTRPSEQLLDPAGLEIAGTR